MTTTLSLVPIQALSTTSSNGLQMSGPYILVRATTVAQQVQANRKLGKKPVPPSPKEPEALRCKRRTDSNALHNILPRPQPAAVARRNERERNRVKMVNNGFDTLREHVPFGKKNKKMSKVDTLKAAADYIKYLQEILSSDTSSLPSPVKTNLAESTETSSDSQVTEDPALEKINSCTENITNGDEIQQRLGDSQYIDISNSSGQKDCENNNIACYENNNNLSSINNNNNNNNNQIGSNAENSCFTFINHSQNGQVDNNDFFASLQDNTNFSFCAALRDPEGFGFVRSPTVSNASSMHSPSPSLCSDAISDNLSSEEDELPDIGSWFS